MKKEKRKAVATAQKVVDTISEKLEEEKGGKESKINLSKIAKDLATRRERVLNAEENSEENN